MIMTNEAKAKALKWGLGLTAAVLISPVIFLAVKGIIGLGLALVVGLVLINGAPVLAMKAANLKLKGIRHEASRNPVETLQHEWQAQREALTKFKESITTFRTEVANFASQVEGFAVSFPADAPKFAEQQRQMERLLQVREARYKGVKDELEKFQLEINRAEAIWKMSQAAQRLNKAAGMNEDDFLARIKTETAIDAVQTSLNRAFAELETSLMDETPVIGLSASELGLTAHVIDAQKATAGIYTAAPLAERVR
jgi:hypothetical protein